MANVISNAICILISDWASSPIPSEYVGLPLQLFFTQGIRAPDSIKRSSSSFNNVVCYLGM